MVQAYSPQPGSPTGRLGSARVTQISESYRLSIISEELGIKKENTEEQKQKNIQQPGFACGHPPYY
jgi:hypothetical protein